MKVEKHIPLILIFLGIIFIIFSLTYFPFSAVVKDSIRIDLNKNEFFSGETLQVEITGNFLRPITKYDIAIKKSNMQMPVSFYVKRINAGDYFAYATLNLPPGNYVLEIKTTTSQGIEVYRENIKIIKTYDNQFNSLLNFVKSRWRFLNNRELIYSVGALNEFNDLEVNNGFYELFQRQNQLSDLEKAIELIAINTDKPQWQIQKSKILNYFLFLQDNLLGTYLINIKSPFTINCSFNKTNYSVSGEKNISYIPKDSINVSLSCFKISGTNITNMSEQEMNLLNVSLFKLYLTYSRKYALTPTYINTGSLKYAMFSIARPLGGINQDPLLTSIVMLGFYKNNVSNYQLSYNWLVSKAELGTLENVMLGMLGNTNAINNLIQLQNIDGSFNNEDGMSKAEITCMATKLNLSTKALVENWVEENIDSLSLRDKASCLLFGLKKYNAISFFPGIIKINNGESFDIYISNIGMKNLNLSLTSTVLNMNYSTELNIGKIKKITVTVPYISYNYPYFRDKIILNYPYNTAEIPLIIIINQSTTSQQQNKTQINETEVDELNITETTRETNLKNIFYILNKTLYINVSEKNNLTFLIKNIANTEIRDVLIYYSSSLFNIISLEPSFINSMQPREEKIIKIKVKVNNLELPTYKGNIVIEGNINGTSYSQEIELNIISNNQNNTGTTQSCANLGGFVCSVEETCEGQIQSSFEGECCIGKCIKKNKKNIKLGLIFLFLGLIIIGIGVLFLLKKPKRKKSIEEAIKRIQEKNITRPLMRA